MWYSMIGAIFTIVIGLIVSFLTRAQDPEELDPALISPPIDQLVKWMFPEFRFKVGWDLGAKKKVRKQLSLHLHVFYFHQLSLYNSHLLSLNFHDVLCANSISF